MVGMKWLALGAMLFSGSVFAMKGVQIKFVNQYTDVKGSDLDNCETCHSPVVGDFLNQYGIDLRENNMDFSAIEKLDSDGDGVSNIDEINAKSLPGSQALSSGVFLFTNRMGDVTFRHDAHIVNYTRGLCVSCHQSGSFERNFDDTVLMQDTAHEVCLTCHKTNGTWAPTECLGCHSRKK